MTLKEIRFFRPSTPEAEFRGNRQVWLATIDSMIASAGEGCPHPLSSYDVHDLYPWWKFQGTERQRRKRSCSVRSIAASTVVKERIKRGLIRR
ncbi:hypothetical protein [Pantoea agglomerans]|uniref:hypothetical protein n=1 Tax=Enterobacter agglomerans TaxID=549 RepID=UPI001303908A|nr:hypothetical protein [Pantoea agglomerans]